MKALKKQTNIEDLLDSVLDFDSEEEHFEFEERVINSDFMALVADMMRRHKIKTRKELAQKLGVTPAYISKLFRGDKLFNVRLLVKLQRLFDTRFKVVDKFENNRTNYIVLQVGKPFQNQSDLPVLATSNIKAQVNSFNLNPVGAE